MATQLNKVRIQRHLVSLVKNGVFSAISYDDQGMAVQPDDSTTAPVSVRCNEISSAFSVDDNHGRSLAQKRDSWVFEIKVQWNKEVSLELFEENWLDNPPLLAKNDAQNPGTDNIRLLLTNVQVTHPVEQGSPVGTKAVLTVEARTHRI